MYIDESGDLGFTNKSSKIFVIACVVFDDDRRPQLIVKHVRQRELPRIGTQELKWNKSSPEIKERILKRVGEEDIDIGYAAVTWKDRVSERLRTSPEMLYNYLAYQVVRWLANRRRGRSCEVILDRSMFGFRERNLNEYIESDGFKVVYREWEGQLVLVPSKLNVHLSHKTSDNEPGLQVADFISGAIFHYLMSGEKNNQYYRHISSRICGQFKFPRQ